jgi:hypothetical protein
MNKDKDKKTPEEWLKINQDKIDAYNSKHEYVTFSSPQTNNYDLGCMCPHEDSDTSSMIMQPFDHENVYTEKTAIHNISIFYNKLKRDEHEQILNKQIKLNESSGLSFNIVGGYFNDDINYFTKQIQNKNILTTGTVNTFTDLNSSTNNYTKQINTFFSVEWTGYFKSADSGYYQFEIISDDSSLLWFDEIALVGYNTNNLSLDNRGLHGNKTVKSVNKTVLANQYYPIRIHYGQNGGGKTFKFNIYKQAATGKLNIVPDPTIYLKSLVDSSGPWEPLQIYYALHKTANSATHYNVQITEYNVSNNYSNNKALRLAKSLPKIVRSSYWKTENADSASPSTGHTLHFTTVGDVLLLQNGSQIQNISNISAIPQYSTCSGGTAITQIKLNICSIDYTDLRATDNGNNTTTVIFPSPPDYKCRNRTTKQYNATLSYQVGTTLVNKPIRGSPGQPITISSKPQFNNCNFKLTLTNSGDLVITNSTNNQSIWSLFKTYKINVPTNTIVNPDWIRIYNQHKQQNMDLSILPVDSIVDPTSGISLQARPYLLSQNGKFKLIIDNKNIELHCCRSGCNNKITNLTYTKYNDVNDSNVVYLYGLPTDKTYNQVFYVDNDKKTLSPVIGDILQLTNTFKSYASTNNNYFPPNQNMGPYTSFEKLNKSQCESKCLETADCTQYYSYKKGGVDTCTIGTHDVLLYPNHDSSITGSSIHIRNKIINSKCKYTSDAQKQLKSVDNTNRMSYSTYSFIPSSSQSSANEGSCNNGVADGAVSNIQNMYKPKKEGFSIPGYTGDYGSTICKTTQDGSMPGCINDLSNNNTAIKTYLNGSYRQLQTDISNNDASLRQNIDSYNSSNTTVNPKYDAIDSSGNLSYKYDNNNQSLNVNDVYLSDLNDNIIQQNLLYIIGTITTATLLIAAIIISRK